MPKSRLGFKTSVIQMAPAPGNVRTNVQDIIGYIERARFSGSKLVVFPELCTSGYLLGDRWENSAFIEEIEEANNKIAAASIGLVVVWGSVVADHERIGQDGRLRKYNAACIAKDGKLVGFIPKTNLPNYRMFDDARHFFPASSLALERGIELSDVLETFDVEMGGKVVRLALMVCEDGWDDEYVTKPSRIYRDKRPDLVIDLSQSPWTEGKRGARDRMLHKRALDADAPILYVNATGLQNNGKNLIWFDGGSCLMGPDGEMRWTGPTIDVAHCHVNVAALIKKAVVAPHITGMGESKAATIAAMRDFYRDFKRVVIGLSGGIDSMVSLAMHVEALGADRVLAVNMPTKFNSETTRNLAAQGAENFGVEYRVVSIQKQYKARLRLLRRAGYMQVSAFDRGNIQARIRGQVLADISAVESSRLGGRCTFTCNGNKTEIALNFFTLYGDGAGGSAFFADYWKGEMYELAALINEEAGWDRILQGVINIVPAHELDATQDVDQGQGDPIFYPFHDKLLLSWTEGRVDPTAMMRLSLDSKLENGLGCASGVVARFFPTRKALVDSVEWAWGQYSYEGKRHMLPPGFIRTRRAFGFDRRDTIAPGYFTEAYAQLKQEYLAGEGF